MLVLFLNKINNIETIKEINKIKFLSIRFN